jgi:hypothetical protein
MAAVLSAALPAVLPAVLRAVPPAVLPAGCCVSVAGRLCGTLAAVTPRRQPGPAHPGRPTHRCASCELLRYNFPSRQDGSQFQHASSVCSGRGSLRVLRSFSCWVAVLLHFTGMHSVSFQLVVCILLLDLAPAHHDSHHVDASSQHNARVFPLLSTCVLLATDRLAALKSQRLHAYVSDADCTA